MSALGMNKQNGRAMADLEHIRQSIADILGTPVNSRVMRRDYGSQVPDLIDAPINSLTIQLLRAASVMAILRWEKRIMPTRINFSLSETPGEMLLDLDADRVDGNRRESVSLTIPVRGRA